jgi:hypothetical protein
MKHKEFPSVMENDLRQRKMYITAAKVCDGYALEKLSEETRKKMPEYSKRLKELSKKAESISNAAMSFTEGLTLIKRAAHFGFKPAVSLAKLADNLEETNDNSLKNRKTSTKKDEEYDMFFRPKKKSDSDSDMRYENKKSQKSENFGYDDNMYENDFEQDPDDSDEEDDRQF